MYCQAQRLAQEIRGLTSGGAQGKQVLAVAEDCPWPVLSLLFGPETQETADNLHHLLTGPILSNLSNLCVPQFSHL